MSTLASHHAPSQRDEGSAAVGKESIELRGRLESVYFRRSELSAAELARFEAFREVGNTYESSANPNWDESGANQVSHTVFTEALRFLRLLPGWVEMPEVGAEPEGSLSFEWYLKPGWTFVVAFVGTQAVEYAGTFGPAASTHGAELFGSRIPGSVLENLRRLFV